MFSEHFTDLHYFGRTCGQNNGVNRSAASVCGTQIMIREVSNSLKLRMHTNDFTFCLLCFIYLITVVFAHNGNRYLAFCPVPPALVETKFRIKYDHVVC